MLYGIVPFHGRWLRKISLATLALGIRQSRRALGVAHGDIVQLAKTRPRSVCPCAIRRGGATKGFCHATNGNRKQFAVSPTVRRVWAF